MVNAAAGAVGSVVGQIAKIKVSVFLEEQILSPHSVPWECSNEHSRPSLVLEISLVDLI